MRRLTTETLKDTLARLTALSSSASRSAYRTKATDIIGPLPCVNSENATSGGASVWNRRLDVEKLWSSVVTMLW